jgi:cold-inducible RNA-binding protein
VPIFNDDLHLFFWNFGLDVSESHHIRTSRIKGCLQENKEQGMNIYVGNLSFDATEDEIRELFEAFGQVASVSLIKDKFSGQPRGFGFVEMADDGEGQKAIDGLNGKAFKNRNLTVNAAKPREERPNRGFGGGGGFDRRGGSGDRNKRQNDRGGGRRSW